MPRIMLRNGAILRRNGKIATAPRCCCPGDEPPLPQSCCYDVWGAWDSGTGVSWPTVLYGQMSGWVCAELNRPFYMTAVAGSGNPSYVSNYVGGPSAFSCVPAGRSWSWRIAIDCYAATPGGAESWGLRLFDSVPWGNGDFTTRYPVTLISCDPLQLRITNVPNIFQLTSPSPDAAIFLSSDPP